MLERLNRVVEQEHLKLGEGGLDAVVRLGGGDMRRTLNILQSTYMASEVISEESVHACTGSPLPRDMERIAKWLLNSPMTDCVRSVGMRPRDCPWLCHADPLPATWAAGDPGQRGRG